MDECMAYQRTQEVKLHHGLRVGSHLVPVARIHLSDLSE